ncbi:MAG: GNAT family N-acetyltransferase [Armatimonadota bacterium]|nr:GNAT family N-acetyltransferase [Armatimonadota bacterium]MDW8104518.1 GNAT family N-acetyltransferase [Armatimonadota bacterium]
MIRTVIVEANWQESLRDPWRHLQASHPQVSPFQTWEWASLWWKHFGRGKQAQILCVQEGKETVGIAPLYARPTVRGRCLRWLGTGISDRLGVVALPEREREVVEALAEWMQQQPCADLHQLPEGSWMARTAEAQGWHVVEQEKCPYITLPETWETYWGSLSKKMRFNLGYAQRQIEREWGQACLHTADEQTLPVWLEALFDLHTRRWRRRLLPGGFFHPRVRQFHREWAWSAFHNGWLRLHALQVGGTVWAVLYVFHFGRRAYYYLGGFEPRLARYSPGTVLTAWAIRRAIEEGCVVFDFLRGDEPYKYRWRPQVLRHRRVCWARGALGWTWHLQVSWETRLWRWLQVRLHGKGVS